MKSLRRLLCCLVIVALSSCGKKSEQAAPPVSGRAFTIAVIPKGTTHEFWKSIEAGSRKAEQELRASGLKVEVIWKGPLREDDRDQQIQVVENFTSKRVSGIVLAPLDSQALASPVASAVQAGISVVIIDSGRDVEQQLNFLPTDKFHT